MQSLRSCLSTIYTHSPSIPTGRGNSHPDAVLLVCTFFKLPEAKTECMENAQCTIGATVEKKNGINKDIILLIQIHTIYLEARECRQAFVTIQQQKNYRQVSVKYPRPFKTVKDRTAP